MKKLFLLVLVLTLSLCVASSANAEKVFHTYMASDTPILNGHNSVETSLDTPIGYCGATLYRAIADETRLNYEYIGEIAAELPEEVSEEYGPEDRKAFVSPMRDVEYHMLMELPRSGKDPESPVRE